MSTTTTPHTTAADGFIPINFPGELFSPWNLTLGGTSVPPNVPTSFQLMPVVENGNIQLLVSDVQYSPPDPANPPVWTVLNATKNVPTETTSDSISIALQSSLGDLLVLTGNSSGGTWDSSILQDDSDPASGTWTAAQQIGENSSFCCSFSWTFLLATANESPQTVILGLDICVEGENGTLVQTSSFPDGWVASNFGDPDNSGIFLFLTHFSAGDPPETYILQNGLFVGGFDALVCQGKLTISPGPVQEAEFLSSGQPLDDGGNWTGTSGGPV